VFAAVIASAFEAFFVTMRLLTLGDHGGGFGSKFLFIAIVGAVVGGVVGFFLGAVLKPRSKTQ
jgi:membrane protein YqaA with SNARE-associated domain